MGFGDLSDDDPDLKAE